MEKLTYVDFGTAKKLSELNYPLDWDGAVYVIKDCIREDGNYGTKYQKGALSLTADGFWKDDIISAPTLFLAAEWIRNNLNLDIIVDVCQTYSTYNHKGYIWCIKQVRQHESIVIKEFHWIESSYEKALEKAIEEAIEMREECNCWFQYFKENWE